MKKDSFKIFAHFSFFGSGNLIQDKFFVNVETQPNSIWTETKNPTKDQPTLREVRVRESSLAGTDVAKTDRWIRSRSRKIVNFSRWIQIASQPRRVNLYRLVTDFSPVDLINWSRNWYMSVWIYVIWIESRWMCLVKCYIQNSDSSQPRRSLYRLMTDFSPADLIHILLWNVR